MLACRLLTHVPPLLQARHFTVSGPAAAASQVLADLQRTCLEVELSSTTVYVPLLPWQVPWAADHRTELQRIAQAHDTWYQLPTAASVAATHPSKDPRALLCVQVNGQLIQVDFCAFCMKTMCCRLTHLTGHRYHCA